MLDPVSIASIIGFSLQCIQLVLGGAVKIRGQAENFRRYEAKMRHYRSQLYQCNTRMASWNKNWGYEKHSQQFSDETLKRYWGPRVFEMVSKLLEDIKSLSAAVGKKLSPASEIQSSPSSTQQEFKHWHTWTKLGRRRRPVDGDETKESKRWSALLFSLYDDKELKNYITELEDKTKLCVDLTREAFDRLRNDNSHAQRKDILVESEELRVTLSKFSSFATKLYDLSDASGSSWSLELRHPDAKGNAANLKYLYDLNMDFTLHLHDDLMSDPKAPGCTRIRILYHPDLTVEEQLEAIEKEINDINSAKVKQDSPNYMSRVSFIGHCEQISVPMRSLFYGQRLKEPQMAKAWELDQVHLLISFVNWMILLLDTPWTDRACCCELRFQKAANRQLHYVLSTMNTDRCGNALTKGEKLQLLGVVLAEILLVRPLRLKSDRASISSISTTSSARLTLPTLQRNPSNMSLETIRDSKEMDGVSGVEWTPIDKRQVLADIGGGISPELANVINFCFTQAPRADNDAELPFILQSLVQKVLKPVNAHVKVIKDQRQASRTLKWWSILVSGCTWPPLDSYDPGQMCKFMELRRVNTATLDEIPGSFQNDNFVSW